MTHYRQEWGATILEIVLVIGLIAVIAVPSLSAIAKHKACKDLEIGRELRTGASPSNDFEYEMLVQRYGCKVR